MLATIRDDTWNVLNMQHITANSKRWDYSDITGGGHKQIKGPAHMIDGGHHLRGEPTPTHQDPTQLLQMKYLNVFPWKKVFVLWSKFHWNFSSYGRNRLIQVMAWHRTGDKALAEPVGWRAIRHI